MDSESLHYEAWSAAVAPHGGGTGWEDYERRFVGKSDRWAGRVFLEEAGHAPDDAFVLEVCQAKHAYYRLRSPERLRIADDVLEVLLGAPAELALGVVSSSPAVDVQPTLTLSGLHARLDVVVCGDQVTRLKPDPEPYLTAVQRVAASRGLQIAPEAAVVFEDSQTGMASARAAGMRVIQVEKPSLLAGLLRAALAR